VQIEYGLSVRIRRGRSKPARREVSSQFLEQQTIFDNTFEEDSQMKRINLTLKTLVVVAGVLVCSPLAHAQQRTFVSATSGNDANNCLRPTPCRNFQRGHDAVAAGGEVVALDSGGYGALSITKSVTITGVGYHAATTAGATAVLINATGATVILRDLTITGGGTGDSGVLVADAANVYIERCVITSFAAGGIIYQTNNRLFITDTVVRNNGEGLFVYTLASGTARINVDNSRFEHNFFSGIHFDEESIEASITNSIMSENGTAGLLILRTGGGSGNTRANVAHSTAANNGGDGFAVGGPGANQLNIEYSVARGNGGAGMSVQDGDTIRVSNSVSTNNVTGFNNGGGTFATRGNNTVDGNTTNLVGALVSANVL
jgi:hypothetical protein